jgi:SIR2-like domain
MEPVSMLAISMESMPGVYGLLVGSGVSSSAGIPTGHQVTLDLIGRIGVASGEDPGPNPEDWFQAKFDKVPSYSSLLAELARRPAERSAILRRYFDPSAADREAGLKVPTAAHKAIARLVAGGYISVILTTNFDRLIEQALEEVGVRPTVISTRESVIGAAPVQHNTCTVIKLHGDYLDENIKNTEEELAEYAVELDALLDRVLDEYGLIVCGWSAQYDTALRRVLERCQNQRYSTYWAKRSTPGAVERRLIDLRRAVETPIDTADSFFGLLESAVTDLAARSGAGMSRGLVNPEGLVTEVERLAADPTKRIQLRRLISRYGAELFNGVADEHFPIQGAPTTIDEVARRIRAYENLSVNMVAISSAVEHMSEDPTVTSEVGKNLRNLTERPVQGGTVLFLDLRRYPALLILYASGLAAIAAENYSNLVGLFYQPVHDENHDEETSLIVQLDPHNVLQYDAARNLPFLANTRLYTPLSEHLHATLRDLLRSFISADIEYDRVFDRYEYLAAMVSVDQNRDTYGKHFHLGRFAWRGQRGWNIQREIANELELQGDAWALLKAGAFDGVLQRALDAKARVDEVVGGLHWRW